MVVPSRWMAGGRGLREFRAEFLGDPRVRTLDSTVAGGPAGLTLDPCVDGSVGQAVELLAGTLNNMPWTARTLSIDGPLRSGDTLNANLGGDPGDLVWVLLSPAQSPYMIPHGTPFVGGPLLPDLGLGQLIVLGSLDATGSLQLSLPVPPLPVTFTRYLQALVFSASAGGETVLSGATALTFLQDGL